MQLSTISSYVFGCRGRKCSYKETTLVDIMYHQFLPAEMENPRKRQSTTSSTTLLDLLTKKGDFSLGVRRSFIQLLGITNKSSIALLTCCQTMLTYEGTVWTAPATWSCSDHEQKLLKVMAESPTRWKQWIDTSVVTALSLTNVSDDWMSAVFTTVVTEGKFPKLTSLTLQSLSVTTLTVLDEIRPKLETLNLAYCSLITDASVLAVASGCSNLQSLNLFLCRNITDASVLEVARQCSNLQSLNLFYCDKITDASVLEVARGCSKLHTLNLANCANITDASVLEVAEKCSNLHTLDLADCENITDASVMEVARGCSNLQTLNLEDCDITDASVMEVARQCSNLQTLNLGGYGSKITDASVLAVASKCSNLQTLNLERCENITEACMNALLQSHPKLEVFR